VSQVVALYLRLEDTGPGDGGVARPASRLIEPGVQEFADLLGSAGLAESAADALFVDYEQGWEFGDVESGDEVGPLVGIDSDEFEGGVVLAALQDLGEVAVNSSRPAVARAVKNNQSWS
jgi:hypothetical protein